MQKKFKNNIKEKYNNKNISNKLTYFFLIFIIILNVFLNIYSKPIKKAQSLMTIIIVISTIALVVIGKKTNKGKKSWHFLLESIVEMKKVIWPNKKETVYSTIIIIFIIAISSIVVYLLGTIFMFIIKIILN